MRTRRTRKHIDDIANKHKLTVDQTQEIIDTFFRFTADVMKEGNKKTMEFDQVRILKWGVFKVKEGRKRFFERLNKKNEELNRNRK